MIGSSSALGKFTFVVLAGAAAFWTGSNKGQFWRWKWCRSQHLARTGCGVRDRGLQRGWGAGEGLVAVTNYHKCGGLKQQEFILSQRWRPEV